MQVEIPFLPEMQMLFLLMLRGNSRAQARLVMVSTVASLRTGLILSDWSVGFPQPLICMSRWYHVLFHSE